MGCIVLGTGCLYTAPVWSPDVNLPPRIVIPPVGPGEEATYRLGDGTPAQVVAQDPDGDDLLFVWEVPGYTLQPLTSVDEGGNWISLLTVPYDETLDGKRIRCFVIDPVGNSTPVVFRVEVQ